jgi:trehalose synthase
MGTSKSIFPLADGTVYSRRKNFCPFSTPPLEVYASFLGEERIEKLQKVARRLKGLKIVELNATAQGGGVAEMLYSSIPFMNVLGIEAEWKIIRGNKDYFECTKSLHNQLQGMKGSFTAEMEQVYFSNLEQCVGANLIDNSPDVVIVHDPQPLGLIRYLKKPGETWLWRCHVDIEEATLRANPGIWDFITDSTVRYDAVIFSAAHYVVSCWLPLNFIIPPFIDPLSEKNREMSQEEISNVLAKYNIDPKVPIIAQIGRFDPWKGIDRTIATYRQVRKEKRCQLILAGGLAADDPQGERILDSIYDETKDDEAIHVLNLSLANRLENYREVNALQRAASVIMQPSTKEGFGLVITEALWKGKPVIATDVGAIPLQIREGDTGYFYQTPERAAQKVNRLLENPQAAEIVGKRGRQHVEEHLLLPDRITDCLMAIDIAMKATRGKEMPANSIISFHPWWRLTKRR